MSEETTKGTPAEPLEVLLVEDNPGDVELTKRRLADSRYTLNISVAEDGEVAMAYLRHEGEHAGAPRPDVILLDLKMPKMGGYEVIEALRADPELQDIEIMILTTSYSEMSELRQKGFAPSRYGHKPIDVEQFDSVVADVIPPPPFVQTKKRWWWPFGNR
jgi:two-component system response regulator